MKKTIQEIVRRTRGQGTVIGGEDDDTLYGDGSGGAGDDTLTDFIRAGKAANDFEWRMRA